MRKQGLRKVTIQTGTFIAWAEEIGLTRALTELQDLIRAFGEEPKGVFEVSVWTTVKRRPMGIALTRYVYDEHGVVKAIYYDADDEVLEGREGAASAQIEQSTSEHDWIDGVVLPSWFETVAAYQPQRETSAASGE